MARHQGDYSDVVYEAAQTWKERCLLEDGSLLSEGASLWTSELLNEIDLKVFEPNFVSGSSFDFFEKLEKQISGFSPNFKKLTAEILWVIFLFQTRNDMRQQTKRDRIQEVWSWSGESLDIDQKLLSNETLYGIGSAGTAYNTHRWRELVLLIKAIRDLKSKDESERVSILSDPWNFSSWLENVDGEPQRPTIHISSHLLFPEYFERVASLRHKRYILSYYKDVSQNDLRDWIVTDIDKELYNLRQRIEAERGSTFDFYDNDMKEQWDPKAESDFLDPNGPTPGGTPPTPDPSPDDREPKNLIIYGPPGTGKTRKLKKDHLPDYQDGAEDRFEFITFHQSYAYEDFVEGIRPEAEDGAVKYEVRWGPLRRICDQARKAPDKRFALFIDEINRGNVAKIFGELITLVEADKRIRTDASGEKLSDCTGLEVTLPYSGNKFGVPVNVDVIGTMNTADRSIALLDSALRRRFDFEELAPQPELLKSIPDGDGGQIDLRKLLEAMNARLTHLLHRDQTLGHSYLIHVDSFEDLRLVFKKKILPFLQEVFYDDWRQIRLVLADDSVEQEELQLIRKRAVTVGELFPGADLSEIGDSPVFEAAPANEITPDAIRKIYEPPE